MTIEDYVCPLLLSSCGHALLPSPQNDVEHFIYVEEYLIITSKTPRSKYNCVKIDVFETVKDA